jgi:hypothetical protein
VIAAGVAYTAYSEWRNVHQLGSWAYTSAMPLVYDIGLTPLLQWIVVPALGILILHLLRSRQDRLPYREESKHEAR